MHLSPDLSYNKLADGSGRGLGKLLNGHAPRLACLEVGHNLLASGSGSSIGHALALNCTLTHLNLRMNRCVRTLYHCHIYIALKKCWFSLFPVIVYPVCVNQAG